MEFVKILKNNEDVMSIQSDLNVSIRMIGL